MTVILGKPAVPGTAAWSSMPGWGIVADLTPPELRARRSMVILRRVVAGGLVLVVLLCIGGYVLAGRSVTGAQRTLDAATSQTAVVQAKINRHSAVTRIQTATTGITSQLSTLFTNDVDVSRLVLDLARALPARVSITSINVTSGASSTTATTGSTPDIGTVSLAGTAGDLNDLARYVAALNGLRGVTGVIPATNVAANGSTSWTLNLQLTAARAMYRFGAPAPAVVAPLTTTEAPATDPTTGGS